MADGSYILTATGVDAPRDAAYYQAYLDELKTRPEVSPNEIAPFVEEALEMASDTRDTNLANSLREVAAELDMELLRRAVKDEQMGRTHSVQLDRPAPIIEFRSFKPTLG